MRHLRRFLLRLSSLSHRTRRERELMTPAEARREAGLKFGSIDAVK